MPVLAINIDPGLYEAIDHAVTTGNYSDIQQFFVVAARNQLTLEASAMPEAIGRPAEAPGSPPATVVSSPDVSGLLTAVPVASSVLPEPAMLNGGSAVLWGQVNRVLPIAVGVRVLAHLNADSPTGVPVEAWHESATRVALALRSRLRQLDESAGRRHGSLWSTAFPDDTPASAHRYVNQFLGLPKGGAADGGAAFLGFVAFDPSDSVVTLTTAGAEWAAFANPIFDGDGSPAQTFSLDETTFFINHVKTYRPADFRLLARVAELVEEGRSRVQIDEALAADYPKWKKYIATVRAGALGRLSDLGLLERTRRGLTVDYAMTPLAAEVGLSGAEVGP